MPPAGMPGQGGRGSIRVPQPSAGPATPTKLFLLGRAAPDGGGRGYAGASTPFGADGTCDQKWNGTVWSWCNVTDTGVQGGNLMASAAYHAGSGWIILAGDWDGGNAGVTQCKAYDTAADDYIVLTGLPATTGGHATLAAVVGNTFYTFGGMKTSTNSYTRTNVIQTYPINVGTPLQSWGTVAAVIPYVAKDIFGCVDATNPNLIWGAGGDDDISDPPANSTAFDNLWLWDASTPTVNPVVKQAMPAGRSMAAMVDLGTELIVIGGSLTGTPNTSGTTTVLAYNKVGNSWSTRGAGYPVAVASARACVFNGVIYCGGGWAGGFAIADDPPDATANVYKSSDAGSTWQLHSTLVDMPTFGSVARGAKASGGSILVAL